MKRTKRVAGLITVAVVMTSFLVIGCGDSPTGSITAGDDDSVIVGHAGGDGDVSHDRIKGGGDNN